MANPKKKITPSRKGNRYSKVKMRFRNNHSPLVPCGIATSLSVHITFARTVGITMASSWSNRKRRRESLLPNV